MYLRYKRVEDNILAASCQLTLIFCFIGGGYIRLFEDFSDHIPVEVVSSVMVFASTTAIVLPLVALTLAMVVVMVAITMVLIRKEGHMPIFLDVDTGKAPLLTLWEGQKWHLFLSYIWSTAQE